MNLFYGTTESLTLAQEAQAKVREFPERKTRYMAKWVEHLIKMVRKDIMIHAYLGESSMTFSLEEKIYELEPLKVEFEDMKATYELSSTDKDYLMTEVITYYSKEEQYPHLSCTAAPSVSNTNTILFAWEE